MKLAPVMPVVAVSDADLLAQIAAGTLDALGTLYDRHRDGVRGFLARATYGHADSDDLVHDVFLTAAKIAARYDGRASARPWLIGIAARLVQRRARGLGRLRGLLGRFASTQPRTFDPVVALETRNTLDAIAPVLARMSAAKRVVLLMTELEGMTAPEIARALEIPIGTVWTRLHTARRELIEVLAEVRR
ncbi:MAG TPA: RNA polymerase sigma factor [Kofleriaceae bacterium]|jgi:RNA polymerase sigma-70 factor (ECF subfamily)